MKIRLKDLRRIVNESLNELDPSTKDLCPDCGAPPGEDHDPGCSEADSAEDDEHNSYLDEEALTDDLDEASFDQAKNEGPLKSFVSSMNSAKQALGTGGAQKALADLYQSNSDQAASAHIEKLLDAVKKIDTSISAVIKWLDKMPEVSKDPWHQTRKRDD